MKDMIKKLHPLERKVLPFLRKPMLFERLVEETGLQEVEVMRAAQWLMNKHLAEILEEETVLIRLDVNGEKYAAQGLPEIRFLKVLKEKPLPLDKIKQKANLDVNEVSISLGLLKKKRAIALEKKGVLWISKTNSGKGVLAKETGKEKFLKKKFPLTLDSLTPEEKGIFKELRKRKNILKADTNIIRTINPTKEGKKLAKMDLKVQGVGRLTPEHLKCTSWKGKEFRRFDVEVDVPAIFGGKRHFTNQVVAYIKSIWLELGFKEMTGTMVQTSFWDLDALFVPQDHPARDMQDTFYLKEPAKGNLPNKNLVKRVKKTHEDGWTTGSKGWQYAWSREKAEHNLLRTHTTVLSAQTIAELKQEDLPKKFFSVGKVFRNETLDWKHLFEFYQVEGIVVDPDGNFTNLLGYLREFFGKMGYSDIRIRPAHFPYTEPSAEVEVFHPKRKEWVELGGSGIFRPEVTKPLFGRAVPVLAWGLGLGRLVSEYWDISDLRELYKNDIKQLREMKLWLR